MRFKYQKYLDKLPNCPPTNYESEEIVGFRFVFKDPRHKNNFLPVLIIKPNRINSFNDEGKCKGYGLSLYDSLENAKASYSYLQKRFKNINRTIGTHIAEGLIDKEDGVVSEVGSNGHFTLHESENSEIKSAFNIAIKVHKDGKD